MTRTWTIDGVRGVQNSFWDWTPNMYTTRMDYKRIDFLRAITDHAIPMWRILGFYSIIERGGA